MAGRVKLVLKVQISMALKKTERFMFLSMIGVGMG